MLQIVIPMSMKNIKPHFIRRNTKEKQQYEINHSKILVLILKRICLLRIRVYFEELSKKNGYAKTKYGLEKIAGFVERRNSLWKRRGWMDIVLFVQKKNNKKCNGLKFIIIFLNRYRKKHLHHTFTKLANNKILSDSLKKITVSRCQILVDILMKVRRENLHKIFRRIVRNGIIGKYKENAVKRMVKLMGRIIGDRKFYVWIRIIGTNSWRYKELQKEMTNELESCRKQLMKKKEQVEQLQDISRGCRGNDKHIVEWNSVSNKKIDKLQPSKIEKLQPSKMPIAKKAISDKKSEQGSNVDHNTSVLSWLNNSFFSIKSGRTNSSKGLDSQQCLCKYRQKYNIYKMEATSLKNQLQIIKTELADSKDLNDHLQREISNLCRSGSTQSSELQILRNEVKQLKKDKMEAIGKLVKSQKYVASLKCEFKMKIENIYRNLKKNNR